MTIAHVQHDDSRACLISLEHEFELIERAKRDPGEFGVLYQRYCPMLLGYVHRRIGDTHATEDLVADIFVIVMRSLPSYQCRGVPLRSWLYRIATNAVNRWARRQKRAAAPQMTLL